MKTANTLTLCTSSSERKTFFSYSRKAAVDTTISKKPLQINMWIHLLPITFVLPPLQRWSLTVSVVLHSGGLRMNCSDTCTRRAMFSCLSHYIFLQMAKIFLKIVVSVWAAEEGPESREAKEARGGRMHNRGEGRRWSSGKGGGKEVKFPKNP